MNSLLGASLDLDALAALADLLLMLIMDPRAGVLFVLLLIAAASDYRTFKIPNWLTLGGAGAALIYSTLVPFSIDRGFLWSLGGLGLGLLVLLPFYAVRIMGAGDVKLMAMVGAFLGPANLLYAVIFTFIFGGIFAIAFSLYHKAFARMLGNVKATTQFMFFSAMAGGLSGKPADTGGSVGRLPYGISISVGTVTSVLAKQLGYL